MTLLKESVSVLIVEDDAIITLDLVRILKQFGFTVAGKISRGEDVIPFLKNNHPDIILMDIILAGDCDGITAAAEIACTFDIPVIYTTSHSDRDTMQRAMGTAPFGYIMKPYSSNDIYSTIQLALMRHKKEKAENALNYYHTFYKHILESIDDGIFVTDADGYIIYINTAMKNMKLFSKQISEGAVLADLLPDETGIQMLEIYNAALNEMKNVSFSNFLMIVSGFPRYISGEMIPYIVDGCIKGMIGSVKDNTEIVNLQRQIIEVDDMRKARIGRDLHDSLGQILTGISLMVKSAEVKFSAQVPDASEVLGGIDKIISEAIAVTRSLSQGLVPVEFHAHGLFDALDNLASRVSNIYGIPCLILGDRSVEICDNTLATHIFMAAQEGVNNAIRHGHAENIEISLIQQERQFTLTISNNGQKYMPHGKSSGIGLHILNYRAGLYGGKAVLSADGRGWTILVCTFNVQKTAGGMQ